MEDLNDAFVVFHRYDEWVRSDRIVAVVDRPDMTKLKKKSLAAKSPKVSTHSKLKHNYRMLQKYGFPPTQMFGCLECHWQGYHIQT